MNNVNKNIITTVNAIFNVRYENNFYSNILALGSNQTHKRRLMNKQPEEIEVYLNAVDSI
jgi:hypothetical protein